MPASSVGPAARSIACSKWRTRKHVPGSGEQREFSLVNHDGSMAREVKRPTECESLAEVVYLVQQNGAGRPRTSIMPVFYSRISRPTSGKKRLSVHWPPACPPRVLRPQTRVETAISSEHSRTSWAGVLESLFCHYSRYAHNGVSCSWLDGGNATIVVVERHLRSRGCRCAA